MNMGSMNFGLYPMLDRYTEFKHGWERDYLEGSRANIFRNSLADIEQAMAACSAGGTRFEFECYDIGHLYTLAHFVARGLVEARHGRVELASTDGRGTCVTVTLPLVAPAGPVG